MGSEDLAYSAYVIWIILVLFLDLDNPWSVLHVLYGKQHSTSVSQKIVIWVWIDMRENDKRELSLIKLHFFYSYYILAHRRWRVSCAVHQPVHSADGSTCRPRAQRRPLPSAPQPPLHRLPGQPPLRRHWGLHQKLLPWTECEFPLFLCACRRNVHVNSHMHCTLLTWILPNSICWGFQSCAILHVSQHLVVNSAWRKLFFKMFSEHSWVSSISPAIILGGGGGAWRSS